MLMRLLSTYLLRRLLGGGRRGGRRASLYGRRLPAYGWRSPAYGRRSRPYGRRRRGGFRFVGPFPTYSTRSRGGSRVTVSGCCLPIPLALVAGAALGARSLLRR